MWTLIVKMKKKNHDWSDFGMVHTCQPLDKVLDIHHCTSEVYLDKYIIQNYTMKNYKWFVINYNLHCFL